MPITYHEDIVFQDGKPIWALPEGEEVDNLGLYVSTKSGKRFYMNLANRVPILLQNAPDITNPATMVFDFQ